MIKTLSLTLTALLCLHGCQSSNHEPETYHDSILQFGTIINVTVMDTPKATAQQAFNVLQGDYAYWHSVWSPWVSGPMTRVNSLIPTEAGFNLPLHIIPLIQRSQVLFNQSEGLFNPAIGKLINLWKFHEHEKPGKQPPADEEIKKLVSANPGMDQLKLSNITLQSSNKDIQLNFGAFAKGYAIEKSMQTLRTLGINNAVINAGGDLKVIGKHGNRPWRVAIRHPRNTTDIIAAIDVDNEESVFTSGDYERNFSYNNKRYHHILDPRTGYPANGSQSVTVIHNDAGTADAAATALFVAGPDNWYRIAKKMGIKYVLLIDKDGVAHMNPAMQKRVKQLNNDYKSVKLSPAL